MGRPPSSQMASNYVSTSFSASAEDLSQSGVNTSPSRKPRSNLGKLHIQNGNNLDTSNLIEQKPLQLQPSPRHSSYILNDISFGDNQTVHQNPVRSIQRGNTNYLLKVSNLPGDLTEREAYALFALAEGITNIELMRNDQSIPLPNPPANKTSSGQNQGERPRDKRTDRCAVIATFCSLELACCYAYILDSRSDLFGPEFPYKIHAEIFDETTREQIPYQKIYDSSIVSSVFNQLCLLDDSASELPKQDTLATQATSGNSGEPKNTKGPTELQASSKPLENSSQLGDGDNSSQSNQLGTLPTFEQSNAPVSSSSPKQNSQPNGIVGKITGAAL